MDYMDEKTVPVNRVKEGLNDLIETHKQTTKRLYCVGIGIGFVFGMWMGGQIRGYIQEFRGKEVPRYTEAQSPYIVPSEIRINCLDGDNNGQRETVMSIGDNKYSIIRDVKGNPSLVPYEVKPAEIVLGEKR